MLLSRRASFSLLGDRLVAFRLRSCSQPALIYPLLRTRVVNQPLYRLVELNNDAKGYADDLSDHTARALLKHNRALDTIKKMLYCIFTSHSYYVFTT